MNNHPPLIGLSGKSGSGKSTAADYLRDQHGYHQFAFANALKDLVMTAFDFSDEQLYGALREAPDPRFNRSPRWCLQYLGTDVFRRIWPEIWIWHLRRDILEFLSVNGQRPCVVTDVRFEDEAEALKRLGAVLVRIERADMGLVRGGFHPAAACRSDSGLDEWGPNKGWDHVIGNYGTKEQLFENLKRIVNPPTL